MIVRNYLPAELGVYSKLSSSIFNLTNRFHAAVCLFSNRSQMTSKCGKNKKVALMFLPHSDVLCDLFNRSVILNRRTATWNLFVLYNNKLKYTGKMLSYFKFRHFDSHENSTDVSLRLYKMKRTDWLLCLAKNYDWFKFKI